MSEAATKKDLEELYSKFHKDLKKLCRVVEKNHKEVMAAFNTAEGVASTHIQLTSKHTSLFEEIIARLDDGSDSEEDSEEGSGSEDESEESTEDESEESEEGEDAAESES